MTNKKKIIMITGHQRSGTTALMNSLSRDPNIELINESLNNELFYKWNLKPEKEIRSFLNNLKKPLLTKPVNETKKRGIIELFDEYKDYDLYIIFLYRNPVNVYFSQLMKRIKDQNNLFGYNEFMDRWNLRNKHVIEALSYYKDKIFLVRYEDLIANKRVFFDLCKFVDIDGDYIFEKDSNKGVNNLHEEVIHELTRGTSKIINLLDSNRTYKNNTKSLICRITNLSPFN